MIHLPATTTISLPAMTIGAGEDAASVVGGMRRGEKGVSRPVTHLSVRMKGK